MPKPFVVMYVEDHPHMRTILRPLVRSSLKCDFMLEARDGMHALEMLASQQVDLILCDLVMPGLDGLEFVRLLRRAPDSTHRTTPVLVISAKSTRASVKAARDAGANGFIAKPVTGKTLLSAIVRVMEDDRLFIETASYFGPDRRRRDPAGPGGHYQGPFRREADRSDILAYDDAHRPPPRAPKS